MDSSLTPSSSSSQGRVRKQSKISQLLVTPIVNITRKLSRREKSDATDDDDVEKDDVLDEKKIAGVLADVSDEFLSEMKEVFREFDRDKSGFICTREMGPLLRAMGNNPTHEEVINN